jgi:hypothetical protein
MVKWGGSCGVLVWGVKELAPRDVRLGTVGEEYFFNVGKGRS